MARSGPGRTAGASDLMDPDRLQEALRQTEENRQACAQNLLADLAVGPLIRGTFRFQDVTCGRPGCRCEQGELHPSARLYGREGGRCRCFYVPIHDRQRVDECSNRYRRVRTAQTALRRLGQQSLALVHALEVLLTEPYSDEHVTTGSDPRVSRAGSPPKKPQG